MELLVRPKSKYLLQASLEELHKGSIVWRSELEFWQDEHKFMMDLIGKYFLKMSVSKRLQHGQGLVSKIEASDQDCKVLLGTIVQHERHLSDLLDNAFEQDEHSFREEHQKLEDDIIQFMKEFKEMKKDMFVLIEGIIRDDKAGHLLKD